MTDDDWPFDQTPRTAAITVQAILDGAPILLVSHDPDDDGWQFLDGGTVVEGQARVIGMPRRWRATRRCVTSPTWSPAGSPGGRPSGSRGSAASTTDLPRARIATLH
jgi:hypothetical protein